MTKLLVYVACLDADDTEIIDSMKYDDQIYRYIILYKSAPRHALVRDYIFVFVETLFHRIKHQGACLGAFVY